MTAEPPSRAAQTRPRPTRRRRWLVAPLGLLGLLAGCGLQIYTLGGPGHGDRFVIPPGPAMDPSPVVQSWVAYSLARSTCQLERGGAEPSRHRSFDCELGAREVLAERWATRATGARDAATVPRDAGRRDGETASAADEGDPYLDLLVEVRDAGFLAEYVWHHLHERGWTRPEGLRLDAFADWRAARGLRWHRPQTRVIGFWTSSPD